MNITYVGFAVVAVFIMIFLYVRGENFRRELEQSKRQCNKSNKEMRYLTDVVFELAKEEQAALSARFQRLQKRGTGNIELHKFCSLVVEASEYVISGATVGHQLVQDAFKEYTLDHTNTNYEDFNKYLLQADGKKRQAWSKNTLHDYLVFCKLMLDELESN